MLMSISPILVISRMPMLMIKTEDSEGMADSGGASSRREAVRRKMSLFQRLEFEFFLGE